MNTFTKFALTAAIGLGMASGAWANDAHHAQASASAQTADTATLTEGEVKKVDKEAGKITIKHGELKNLSMPAMTMVFQVQDKAMLDQVKVGDKIRFAADKVNGRITVIRLETIK